jgi:hypothetical protein
MEQKILNRIMKLSEDMSGKTHFLESICKDGVGIPIESLGLTQDDLSNTDYWYEVDKNEVDTFDKDSFKTINLYKYVSNSYGPSNIGSKSRGFCKTLAGRTNASLMRYSDIQALNSSNPGLGKGGSDTYSVFDFRGGSHCVLPPFLN